MSDNKTVDFVRQIVSDDNDSGKHRGRVHTRFPPEPNGYLHIGHAKSICLNFGIAEDFDGQCNLRFDDTNPEAEDTEYVDSIKGDVKWLGYHWEGDILFASNYFEQIYAWAVELINKEKAYVCELPAEMVSEYRGRWNEPGKDSPYRNRSVEENLELFEKMKNGGYKNGEATLRAKIDMSSSNMNMRDPTLYRVRHARHHRTGNQWCIYPTYDFTHGQSDSIEGITHSVCTLEFENHRPLYDWCLDQLEIFHPQQIEFARLNLSYSIMSKRKLLQLVEAELVKGWDDPRMPTLSGLRRKGYTPESIRNFCQKIGVTKTNSLTEINLLEQSVREHLNRIAPRVFGVLKPLKVVIENYPEDQVEYRDAVNNPEDPEAGTRKIKFGREIFIDRDDFMEDPPKKFFRLRPGGEVRLRYAYFLKCHDVVKDQAGEVVELRCTYDPATAGGKSPDGRKVKATLHWVSAEDAVDAEIRLYEHLLTVEDPGTMEKDRDWLEYINPNSCTVLAGCKVESGLRNAAIADRFQFERVGYFAVDPDSSGEKLVFNRTVSLKDDWAKIREKK
ncbi:glutamine--tRNA ligase/YqeY domain fusion protein [Mariniblastus sp.]|nr:glutamine--tRNA ligase/YqeY domain fusion protein [Mariniblastus sp.]MDB4755766.1 glutamine--tRNA ligase/YqeY domain fusion protein [Mariniblastus sp.]